MKKTYKFNKGELESLEADNVKMYQIVKCISEYVFARLGKDIKFEDAEVNADFSNYQLYISYIEPQRDFIHIPARELVDWNWQKTVDKQYEWFGPLCDVEFPEKPCDFTYDIVERDINLNRRLAEFKSAIWDYILNGEDELYDEICFAYQEENIQLGDWRMIDGELCLEVLSEMDDHLTWIPFSMDVLEDGDWKMIMIEIAEHDFYSDVI